MQFIGYGLKFLIPLTSILQSPRQEESMKAKGKRWIHSPLNPHLPILVFEAFRLTGFGAFENIRKVLERCK
ncbi:hypothetical protein HNY73_009577 [Argiope bruennichi]|uniref:Uncharacterized protein n=1 Tax=Argiope bruennichi TaxID=94029 RepID=A0A8T0FFI7_ARGBR|nr:hypothetical protein HNY73_009577 [Argiope bruennichi]